MGNQVTKKKTKTHRVAPTGGLAMLQDRKSGEGRHTDTPMTGKLAIFARGITNNAHYSVL